MHGRKFTSEPPTPLEEGTLNVPFIADIQTTDKQEILELVVDTFSYLMSRKDIYYELRNVDFKISKKLVLGNELIGANLMSDIQNIDDYTKTGFRVFEDLTHYGLERGLKGEALVIKKEYAKYHYGIILLNYSIRMGYDFIWWEHFKALSNLVPWTKFRLVAESDETFITLMDCPKRNPLKS